MAKKNSEIIENELSAEMDVVEDKKSEKEEGGRSKSKEKKFDINELI